MNVRSTRGSAEVPLSLAIAQGQAPDGGLYMPPVLAPQRGQFGDTLPQQAVALLAPFFAGDELAAELPAIVGESFTFAAPTIWLDASTGLLELFHGPTAAFKDFGARFLAACMARLSAGATRAGSTTTVLVATSGDTGAAVAAAFHGRPGFRVLVLYPDGRVSPRQAHQLGCFGGNVAALRVAGTFDDCQRLVKEAFAATALVDRHHLTSANSISIGRLLPQMAYYAHAALRSVVDGRGAPSFVVPTGNLGNALACLLAKDCGLPIGRVVLATNANRVLPDFLASGRYEPRASIATLANAMDVGAPSNLERLRHRYAEPARVVEADWVDDVTIQRTIVQLQRTTGQIVCPHTACGFAVLQRLRARGATGPWIVAATAHPAKFAEVIEPLIGGPVPVPEALSRMLVRPSAATSVGPELRDLVAQLG